MIWIRQIDYERSEFGGPRSIRIELQGCEDAPGEFERLDTRLIRPLSMCEFIDFFLAPAPDVKKDDFPDIEALANGKELLIQALSERIKDTLVPLITHRTEATKAYRFLAGLQLGDQPAKVQREYLAVMAMLGKGLGNVR